MTRYAGFWDRFLADLVDGLILTAAGAGLYFLVDRPLLGLETIAMTEEGMDFGVSDAAVFGLFLYNMTYRVGRYGQSWGRQLLRICVVSYEGQPIGFVRSLGRNLFASLISSFFYLGFLWMIWDAKKQAWHDKVFRTLVLDASVLRRRRGVEEQITGRRRLRRR